VSINGQQAENVFFANFRRLVERTTNPKTGKNWFAEKGLDLQKAILKREIRFPKDITAYSLNSEEYTGEGLNLFVAILDEVAVFDPLKAKELYTNLKTSCRSRFPQHMKLILLSYKRSDNDFMMLRFREAEREPTTYRDKAATWEVNLTKKKEDFAADYTTDPESAQRIYECEGSSAEDSYYRYRHRTAQVLHLTPNDNPIEGDRLWTYDVRSIHFKPWFKREVGARYFLHVDLAAGRADACGIAMGHRKEDMVVSLPPEFVHQVLKRDGTDLSAQQGTRQPGVVIDLVLQVRAHKGGEIIFEEVRQFIERLKTSQNFDFQKVTFDGWQSLDSIQQLKQAGIAAAVQSIDKTPEAHQALKGLIYQGLIECYEHPILIRELEELIVMPDGQADHPVYSLRRAAEEDGVNRGSKDVADAVAGCAYLCLQEKKSEFKFWSAGEGDPLKERPDLMKKVRDMYRYESDELVRYGEKPKSWYRRFI